MPQRSWLAKAQSVNDLGITFYNSSEAKPWSDEREARLERKWLNLTRRPMPVAPADAPYFGCSMHDSGVLGIERTPSFLRVRLDSINARDFSLYLADTLGLPRVETVWPVDLLLHEPQYVRAAYADLRGGLRFLDWSRLENPEFLYDWAFDQEGRIQWIAHLWRSGQHVLRGSGDVYLMIDCARMTADDRCVAVFARHYGEPAARLYLDAVARIDEKPFEFDVYDSQRETPDYIRRRMAAHGFTRDDFSGEASR